LKSFLKKYSLSAISAMSLHLDIITPETTIFSGDVESVTLPTAQGELTILPRHIPLISIVVPGTVMIKMDGKIELFAVSRGVVEVDGKTMRVLADTADRAAELEEAAIEAAKASAEKLMSEKRDDAETYAEASAVLARELARLKTVRRHRSKL
jgi:F-type H+-transporting ATPase subunit epsilon